MAENPPAVHKAPRPKVTPPTPAQQARLNEIELGKVEPTPEDLLLMRSFRRSRSRTKPQHRVVSVTEVTTPVEVREEIADLDTRLDVVFAGRGIIRGAKLSDNEALYHPGIVIAERFRDHQGNPTVFNADDYRIAHPEDRLPEPFSIPGFSLEVGLKGRGKRMTIPQSDGSVKIVGIVGDVPFAKGRSAGINRGDYQRPLVFGNKDALHTSTEYQDLVTVVSNFEDDAQRLAAERVAGRGWIGRLKGAQPSEPQKP